MANYIETKIRFDKTMENGTVRKVTERYLVDALSFTEAEARITEEQSPYISGDFTVSAVKKTKIAEIFRNSDAGKFYLAKLNFITIDERTASEKKCAHLILIEAYDFKDALDNLQQGMEGTMADYEVASLTETDIMDVYDLKTAEAECPLSNFFNSWLE